MTEFRKKARDRKLLERGIKRQLTAALSAPAEPRKGGGGLEVKQRGLYHDQGRLKEEGTKGQSEEENEREGSSCLPLLLHRGRSVIHHHQRVP